MVDTKFLNDIAKKITKAIPSGMKELQKDVERNIHAVLKGAFSKLDLVTRDEFDAQVKVLARTRSKLEKLEEAFAELTPSATPKSESKNKTTSKKKE